MNVTVGEIAAQVGGVVIGDESVRLRGCNGIRQAREGDLSFISDSRYARYLDEAKASALLVPDSMTVARIPLIQVADPYTAFLDVLDHYCPPTPDHPRGIHPSAVVGENVTLGQNVALDAHVTIADNAVLGDNVCLYAGVYVGKGARIGSDTLIYPNTSILAGVVIGARCIIHSGVVIGSDGFGYLTGPRGPRKIPQMGNVIVQDDVEIGANTAIDRATFGSTIIGNGTKIDNLVQIGHNVEMGASCLICGNAGISGSAILGNGVTIAAGAGVAGHIEVGDGVTVAGLSGVTKSIASGKVVSGFPAMDHERDKRIIASMRRLPETLREVRELGRRVEELENRRDGTSKDHS
jgi:UDP-3-O-[3-hydroxymyristoyl] glucosamine N-acyltransferase